MKTVKFVLLTVAAGLTVAGLPARSGDETQIEGQTKSVVVHGLEDSARRKIALAVGGPGPGDETGRSWLRQPQAGSRHWQKLTVMVPASLAEAADFCSACANRLGKSAAEKVLQTSAWLNVFLKQMTSAPTITPAADIYQPVAPKANLEPLSYSHERWYLPDGRVKTLVQR